MKEVLVQPSSYSPPPSGEEAQLTAEDESGGSFSRQQLTGGGEIGGGYRHVLAPQACEDELYFLKYGDEHYVESTIPMRFKLIDNRGVTCHYITSFLIYNRRGERLVSIESLSTSSRSSSYIAYGFLMTPAMITSPAGDRLAQLWTRCKDRKILQLGLSSKHIAEADMPYPVRIEFTEWLMDYGALPTDKPAIWLISKERSYYRLEYPAERYRSIFSPIKIKFDISSRVFKTLQVYPLMSLHDLCKLFCTSTEKITNPQDTKSDPSSTTSASTLR